MEKHYTRHHNAYQEADPEAYIHIHNALFYIHDKTNRIPKKASKGVFYVHVSISHGYGHDIQIAKCFVNALPFWHIFLLRH